MRATKKTWLLSAGGIILLVVVTVIGWYELELQPVNQKAGSQIVIVNPGTSTPALAKQLQHQHLIHSATAFTVYVTVANLRGSLEAGSYNLSPAQSTPQIAETLAGGKVTKHTILVPEGSTVTQIRASAAKQGISTSDFTTALGANYTSSALAGRPAGDTSLEGYLFPDTYSVKQPPNAQLLLQTMLDTFDHQINATDIPQSFAAEGLTLHQGVTLASIVEKEVSKPDDQAMVAQVFLNRIRAGMPLESDVTVNYATLLTGQPFSTKLNSPYNTYLITGLPPGPICNPGIGALRAAAHPTPNNYLYFVAGSDGVTHFAITYQQHQQNVQLFLK